MLLGHIDLKLYIKLCELLRTHDMNTDKFQKHTSSKPHCSETQESEDSCMLKRQYHEFFTSGYDIGK
jgi:hypothetical protein